MDYNNCTFPNLEYFIISHLGAYCIGLFLGFVVGRMSKGHKKICIK